MLSGNRGVNGMPVRKLHPAKNVTDLTGLEQVRFFGRLRGRTSWILERCGSKQISPDVLYFSGFMWDLGSQNWRRKSCRASDKLEPEWLVVVLISHYEP